MKDEIYIKRCLELAEKAKGNTYPNPMVGCVIVYQNKIIGEGYHHKAGEAHAEINAINSVKNPELLPYSTLYVSLEPCSHYGKTPPCANKIVEIGCRKVVIGTLDPNEKVNGKGKKILEDAGIEVISGVLEKECVGLNKRFFTFHQKKRPYIFLKWATSQDGYLDKNSQPYSIGNAPSQQWVHQLRSEEQAILVGSQTVLNDNPSLTTRLVSGKNPMRIIIDPNLKIPTTYNIFNQEAETLIFNTLTEKTIGHIHYLKIEKENFLKNLVEQLYQNKIQSVLVEGGSYTHQQFLDANLWDEIYTITNPNLLLKNGTKAPKINFPSDNTINLRDNILAHFKNPNP